MVTRTNKIIIALALLLLAGVALIFSISSGVQPLGGPVSITQALAQTKRVKIEGLQKGTIVDSSEPKLILGLQQALQFAPESSPAVHRLKAVEASPPQDSPLSASPNQANTTGKLAVLTLYDGSNKLGRLCISRDGNTIWEPRNIFAVALDKLADVNQFQKWLSDQDRDRK